MAMRLENFTNIPVKEIMSLIQFVKPNNLPTLNFDVRVTNSSSYYRGVCYPDGCGYAKKGIGSDPSRPLIIVRLTPDQCRFPIRENHAPKRVIELYWDQYNNKKGKWETWHSCKSIPKTDTYVLRKNKELRDNGKSYDWNKSAGGYIDCLILSREEALVRVLAHELRHLWQKNHLGRRGKVRGARGLYSDRDADAYAIKKMREWRRLHAADIYGGQSDMIPSGRGGICS